MEMTERKKERKKKLRKLDISWDINFAMDGCIGLESLQG